VSRGRGYRRDPGAVAAEAAPTGDRSYEEQIESFERDLLVEALQACGWSQKKAAATLGLNYDQFRHLYRKHNLGEVKPG
jgi:transcriptional regulator with GAF, ATPase, and Fis domain